MKKEAAEEILGKKILFITAHPDDETFLAAGTIYKNFKSGGQNHLYSASGGERGTAYMENPGSPDEVRTLRLRELENAGRLLGIEKIMVGTFPDRELVHHKDDIENEVLKLAREVEAEIIIGFGENGYTGHQDHITIGSIAKKIAALLGTPYASFSHPPESVCKDLNEHLDKKKANGVYGDKILCEQPNIHIEIDPKIKMEAIRCYQTQFIGLDPYKIFPQEIAEHILQNEYFLLCS